MESNTEIASTQSLQQLNQDRLELLELRKQRKKMELLADELNSLENMYTIKVEENLELKTCLKQLKSLVELFEAEKNELQQQLYISKEKLGNYIAESEKLYHQKEQLKALWEREKSRYLQNQRTLSAKAQKLQDSLQQFETRLTRKDRQTSRMSTTYIGQEESLKVLSEKILILTQEIQDKDINMIRLNGQLKIEKDQNLSLKQRLRSSNESIRELTEKCRQVQQLKDRSTQLLQEQIRIMDEEHGHIVESLKHENENYIGKKVSSSKKNHYKDSMRNEINALKTRQFQRIDSLINNKIIRANNDLEFY